MWLTALVASVAAAGPAAPCDPLPPRPPRPRVSAFERQVRHGIDVRRAYGLRADRAWVVRVLRSPSARMEEGYGILSPSERRHFRFRDRIIDGTRVIEKHLRRQAVDVDAGYSIVEDGNGGPYLVYKLAGDAERLEPELRARYPYPDQLRIERVAYTTRELDAVSDRVFEDIDELEREGIHLAGGGADTDANRAGIEVITARPDVQAFFAERYGPAVAVEVIATERYRLVCTPIEGYRPSRTGRSLRIQWTTNSVYQFRRIVVRETARSVEIGIEERAPNGFVTLAATTTRRRVRLAAPLGRRRVLDARTGKRLPDFTGCRGEWSTEFCPRARRR